MKRLLAGILLATTLSAQDVPMRPQPLEMKDGRCFNCNQWNRFVDGNGALEAFYVRPAHHSIFKSKRFWIAVVAVAGSAALTGYLASRSSPYRPGAPTPQQPGQSAQIDPVVGSVNHIGIGGPGIPVVVVKGGVN